MDWLLFLVNFAVLYAAGERQLSVSKCALLGAMPNISYMLASPLFGVVLSRRNARGILIASTACMTLLGVGCLFITSWWWLVAAMACIGFAATGFFNSFQTFMRGETVPGGLGRTVGGYTLAWSVGASAGFLSSGAVYKLGIGALAGVDLLVGGVVLALLLLHRERPHEEASADEHVEAGDDKCREVNPNYVWIGWIIIFCLAFIQRPIQSLLPPACAKAGIEALVPGAILFGHMAVQGVFGWLMAAKRHWLYRRTPMVLSQLAAALLLLLIWRLDSLAAVAVGVPLLGLFGAFGYFCAVYYASNSGRRSFNIGVNECLVGCGSFAGLFVCDRWINATGKDESMYLACGLALAVALVFQVVIASLPAPRPAKTPDNPPSPG